MPEVADKSYKDIIVGKVYIHVIVKGNEFISGNIVIHHCKKRKELVFNFLKGLLTYFINLNFIRIKILHFIRKTLLNF